MPGSAREERHCSGATLQFVPLQQRHGARRAAEAYVAACYDEDADVGLARRPQLCTAALVEVVSTAAPEAHRTAAPSVSGAASRSVCCALYVNKQCAPVRTCTALPVSAHVHGCASAVWITHVHDVLASVHAARIARVSCARGWKKPSNTCRFVAETPAQVVHNGVSDASFLLSVPLRDTLQVRVPDRISAPSDEQPRVGEQRLDRSVMGTSALRVSPFTVSKLNFLMHLRAIVRNRAES